MKNKVTTLVEEYLEYKHNLGFQLKAETVYLNAFAKYTERIDYKEGLTRKIVFQWCEEGDDLSLTAKGRRFEPIKGLADYAHAFDEKSEIMPKLPYGNPHKRTNPHIYTEEETIQLMDMCDSLYSPDGIRSLSMKVAIGLLWSTGMRTAELANLTVEDVDLENGLISIRHSKFNKDRIIPILPDVIEQLLAYRNIVQSRIRQQSSSAFFITTAGKPFNERAFEYAFQQIRDVIDVSDSGYEHARLYDFRHTFATRTIKNWYEHNIDPNTNLFLLSTYLGHAHPEDTYWYLSSTPELLNLSSAKFESMFGGEVNE